MSTKEYLRQARTLDKRINAKLEQVSRLRDLAERTTTILSNQPKGKSGTNRTEYCITKIFDLEREINTDIDRLIDLKATIREAIEAMPNDLYKAILECRYLNGWKWEEIADTLGYERRQVTRLHGRALQEIKVVPQCPITM